MRHFLASLALVLLIIVAPVVHAQKPVQDTIPQLKEWWRADNMKYGKYGMTWLDNFYNGKGALVVWTPNGVQTWQLRFPGDTQNVFTWAKGSSNIKTGDFNGDGITDYIDENSNIYQGIKNGEPPKPESIYFGGYYPEKIIDINGDGYEDVFNFPSSSLPRPPAEMKVAIGNKDISKMNWETIPMKYIDSNNVVVGCYTTPNKELRLICRRYFWHYEGINQVITRDGYRLVRVWWEGNSFQSQVLDEFDVNLPQDRTGLYFTGTLFNQNNKLYWIGVSRINDSYSLANNVTVYDLNGDKLLKLYTTRIDSISMIVALKKSIDSDSIPDLYIVGYGYKNLKFYSGNITQSITQIGYYPTCASLTVTSIPDVGNDGNNDIAISGELGRCFSIIQLYKTIGVEELPIDNSLIRIESITPQPIHNNQILQMKVSVPKYGNYTLSLYDILGKKLPSKSAEWYQLSGEQVLFVNIGDYAVSNGVYTLRLEGSQGLMAQCSVVIE